jgi:hypothetical protein
MRLKLEDEIGHVDTEQEYSSAAGYDQKTPLATFVEISVQHAIHCGYHVTLDWGNDALRCVIRCWNYKGCSLWIRAEQSSNFQETY